MWGVELPALRLHVLSSTTLNFVLNVFGNQIRDDALSLAIYDDGSEQNCEYEAEGYLRAMLACCEDCPAAYGEQP